MPSNVRLQARATRGASHCKPLFGGTRALSATWWNLRRHASQAACVDHIEVVLGGNPPRGRGDTSRRNQNASLRASNLAGAYEFADDRRTLRFCMLFTLNRDAVGVEVDAPVPRLTDPSYLVP
jgi:hypothetical protein